MHKYITLLSTFTLTIFCAYRDIETTRKKVLHILQQKNPQALTEFNNFCNQYYHSVNTFFDINNYESLAKHIQRMERELQLLQKVCADKKFYDIRSLLSGYCEEINNLIDILKQQLVVQQTALGLAFKVRIFKFLLPTEVKSKGDFALFQALRHRINC